jgi:hypothetical protein
MPRRWYDEHMGTVAFARVTVGGVPALLMASLSFMRPRATLRSSNLVFLWVLVTCARLGELVPVNVAEVRDDMAVLPDLVLVLSAALVGSGGNLCPGQVSGSVSEAMGPRTGPRERS